MSQPREYCFYCMNHMPSPDGICPFCQGDNRVRRNGSEELPFARLAGKYLIGRALGRGGFGITYVGLNERLDRRVAIKEYFPENIARRSADHIHVEAVSEEAAAMLEEGKNKALQEARTIVMADSIPNTVRVYDCFSRNNTVYIIMEYVEGETLLTRLSQKGAMKWEDAFRAMRPIGEALQELHQRNLVHRDVSPDNIMIASYDGRSVLLDFGAAVSSRAVHEGDRLRKDGYAPPEQYTGQVSGRSDEYAYCATLYHLITAVRPARAVQRRFDPEAVKPPRKLHADIPESAQAVLMRGMAMDEDDRYPTMAALLDAFDGAEPGSEHGPDVPKQRKTGKGLQILLAGLMSVCLLIFGASTITGLRNQPEIMVRARAGASIYSRPGGDVVERMQEETCLWVQESARKQDVTYLRVCLPVDRKLQVFYLVKNDTEEVDPATMEEMKKDYRTIEMQD